MEMDRLLALLPSVLIPEPADIIENNECCISFDDRKSKCGIFVDMCGGKQGFIAFGEQYVGWNFQKTGHSVYLNVKEDRSHSIFIFPDSLTIPFSDDLPMKIKQTVSAILSAKCIAGPSSGKRSCFQGKRKRTGHIYTGLKNLRNSCYIGAPMQLIFSTSHFSLRYYHEGSLRTAFEKAEQPTLDLNMQLTKLAHGLLSGQYPDGISPRMFKPVITDNHVDFCGEEMQDACLFFHHFLSEVEDRGGELEVSKKTFKFSVQDRYFSSSGEVRYMTNIESYLSLAIPMDKAIETIMCDDGIVRPMITLKTCLETYSLPQSVDYKNESGGTWRKTTGLASFPDYLVLRLSLVTREQEKLDVYVNVPDSIDISNMRSSGVQNGEVLLNDVSNVGPGGQPVVDQSAVVNDGLSDGEGRYRLIGFVTHNGTFSNTGHYVAHLLKDDRWVTFDDAVVKVSENRPKYPGYMYCFERKTGLSSPKAKIDPQVKKNRRVSQPWNKADTLLLVERVKVLGVGKWTLVKQHMQFENRTAMDIKDKWKNLKDLAEKSFAKKRFVPRGSVQLSEQVLDEILQICNGPRSLVEMSPPRSVVTVPSTDLTLQYQPPPRHRPPDGITKFFCYQCSSKFPEPTYKYCCSCGKIRHGFSS